MTRLPKKQSRKFNIFAWSLLAVSLLAVMGIVVAIIYASTTGSHTTAARASTSQSNSTEGNPSQATVTTPKPTNLYFSGSGTSSSSTFEVAPGSYLVSYSFSDPNNGTSDENLSSSKITCSDPKSYDVLTGMYGSGSKSNFMTIYTSTTCTYSVDAGASDVGWTVKIASN